MREILFRGKRIDNGEWVEGNLIQYPLSSYFHIMSNHGFDDARCVLPETVGQFTGLTDKNGKKIFEGDIVKCTDEINGLEFTALVQFGNPNSEYSWGYQLVFIAGDEANLDILCWVEMEETGAYIEVIGNVYDNPELLIKGEQLCFF